QAEDGIRDFHVTGVQTCALPICFPGARFAHGEQTVAALSSCDVVVRSPGISRYRDEVLQLQSAGVQLTTATNLWFAEHGGECVRSEERRVGKECRSLWSQER